jgi:hypothetical protein
VTDLARLEIALRTSRALAELSAHYVHRARREDSLGFLIGRDALLADWVGQERAQVKIIADLGDMIVFEVGDGPTAWRGHRWVVREDNRIIAETLIENRGVAKTAPPAHAPLGELAAGRGQYDAGEVAVLPSDFAQGAIALATWLHKAWNGRAFDLYEAPWLLALLKDLPDATFYFERALVVDDQIAILWRVHGHHKDGQRVRLIGSSVMRFDGAAIASDLTCIDFAACKAQVARPIISY